MQNQNQNSQEDSPKTILGEIPFAQADQLDALWALLRYKDINIHRKLRAMALVLLIDWDESLLDPFPKDADGKLLNRESRHLIHGPLLARSKVLHGTGEPRSEEET